MNYDMVGQHIQRALGLVSVLIEGSIDPFVSERARETFEYLVDAQAALEAAAERWSQV